MRSSTAVYSPRTTLRVAALTEPEGKQWDAAGPGAVPPGLRVYRKTARWLPGALTPGAGRSGSSDRLSGRNHWLARRTAGLGQRVSISSQESAKGRKRERTGEGGMSVGW